MIYYLVIFLPLVSFILAGTIGRKISNTGTNILTVGLMAISCWLSWKIFFHINASDHVTTIPLATWIRVGNFKADWALHFDILSTIMITVVNTVSFMVHLYSVGYMSHDKTVPRFMAYLGLFTFMMLMLVTAPNLLQLFFGWEGVGLASYLLIGYWYEKPATHTAAIKAFVVNRIGDLGLILGLGGLFAVCGSIDMATLLDRAPDYQAVMFHWMSYSFSALETIGLLLFVGAMGKSAQFGLHTWLADAMEGPTPVSALIHAATMVTAGVFLLVKLSPLYELLPVCRTIITSVGAFTALFAGTVALVQNDIKRIIAYSTCSQLGYMFFAVGVSAYGVAMFHLVTHAFFKALLFLGAGSVIHAMSDEQNIDNMGGIGRAIPITYAMMWIGSLALAGIPFFAGYYSKDAILEAAWMNGSTAGIMAYAAGIITALLTAFYAWRLLYKVFNGQPRADEHVMGHLHEPGLSMLIPLAVLAMGSIFAGFIGQDYFLNAGFWQGTIVTQQPTTINAHHPIIDLLPTVVALLGIMLATLVYIFKPAFQQRLFDYFKYTHRFLFNKWYIDEIYAKIIIKPLLTLGNFFWLRGDQAFIDRFGPDGLARLVMHLAGRTSKAQSGLINHYALVIMLGVMVAMGWVLITY